MSVITKHKKLIIRFAIPMLVLVFSFVILKAGCKEVDVSNYTGDGVISTFGVKSNPGFRIDFGDINLGKPFHSKYLIENYPKTNDMYMFGISVSGTYRETYNLLKSVRGTLKMSLFTLDRDVVFQVKDDIGNWWLSWGGDSGFFYYMANNCDELQSNNCISGFKPSHFKKTVRDPLSFEVTFTPAGTKVDFQGKVRMKVGGYK